MWTGHDPARKRAALYKNFCKVPVPSGHETFTHVYRAPKAACRSCALRDQCGPKKKKPHWVRSVTRNVDPAATAAFKAKMETEEAKAIYRQRSQIAEFPHAWMKERCALRQFRCRGREKTSMESTWACLSYNIIRLFSIRRKLSAAAAAA